MIVFKKETMNMIILINNQGKLNNIIKVPKNKTARI